MGSKADSTPTRADQGVRLLHRFVVPPNASGSPADRAARARQAMTGLRAGVPVTKAMYRPGR